MRQLSAHMKGESIIILLKPNNNLNRDNLSFISRKGIFWVGNDFLVIDYFHRLTLRVYVLIIFMRKGNENRTASAMQKIMFHQDNIA